MGVLRNMAIGASRLLIKNELYRKQCVVAFYNAKSRVNRIRSGGDYDFMNPSTPSLKNTFTVNERYRGNALYGIGEVLRSYSGYNCKLPIYIEHGVYFGSEVDADMIDGSLPGIITFSKYRQAMINRKASIDVLPIGPYIHYAQPFLSAEEKRKLKYQLGSTLLVFASHSIEEDKAGRIDENALLKAIENLTLENQFDTVLICMYYNDLLLGRDLFFKDKGLDVVCSGHRYDPAFLSRLKTLISLSDYTLSDGVGTHVGYCIYEHKPHAIVPESSVQKRNSEEEMREITKAFANYRGISDQQLEIVDTYWGASLTRTPEYLAGFFSYCEEQLGGC